MLGTFSRKRRRRSHGHSLRKRIAVSKVAPPHISSENNWGTRCETVSATRIMSKLRMRVAMSDWWASRKVVSVISKRFSSRIHCANFSGPRSNNTSRLPLGTSAWCSMASEFGATALGIAAAGFQPLAVGLPLRVMSDR